jgi:drug/metabolite transporter (DMT)-like permease
MTFIGEIAGLAASFLFSITAIIYTNTGRAVGSQVTNRVRLGFALLYLLILNWMLFGEPLPFSADSSRWVWLSFSGVIGLALGDAFLFLSFVAVGARLGSLLLSLAPIFGAVIAWTFFGETLSALQITGIALALAGISWVVLSHEEPANTPHGHTKRGVIFGILSALGQAVGMVLSKQGLSGNFPPFQASVIRMVAAAIVIWVLAIFQGEIQSTITAIRKQPRFLWWIALGAIIGPVLGVTASLLAVQHAEVGVASTLTALQPVILLPIMYFVFKEKINWQGVAGTLLAILGVAALFLA